MKIKNTKELVLRAKGHARLDHVRQAEYGTGAINGEVEFYGCAIGCLATPHRKQEAKSFLKRFVRHYIKGEVNEFSLNPDDLTKQLSKEFGICEALARSAESCFESCDTHEEAIDFIPAFAAALNEGADITPAKLRAAWERILRRDVYAVERYVERCVNGSNMHLSSEETEKFLVWLHTQGAPKTVTA